VWSALFAFPLSLLLGVVAGFLYKKNYPDWLIFFLCAASLACSFALIPNHFMAFWLPGGLATVLLVLAASLRLLHNPDSISSTMQIDLPPRPRLREVVTNAESPEEKRALYLRLVKDYTKIWQGRHLSFAGTNSRFILYLFFGLFAITFLVLYLEYILGSTVLLYIEEQAKRIEELAPDLAKEQDLSKAMTGMLPFYPGFIFVYCGFSALILLSMLRSVGRVRQVVLAPYGSLVLFKVPENSIWIFLFSMGILLVHTYTRVPDLVFVLTVNFLVILVFLYILQGIGTGNLFLEVRLIPGRWLLILLLFASLFFPAILLTVLFLYFFLGALDFWFEFRKKALQPAISETS
jgi:hypothetical protein